MVFFFTVVQKDPVARTSSRWRPIFEKRWYRNVRCEAQSRWPEILNKHLTGTVGRVKFLGDIMGKKIYIHSLKNRRRKYANTDFASRTESESRSLYSKSSPDPKIRYEPEFNTYSRFTIQFQKIKKMHVRLN